MIALRVCSIISPHSHPKGSEGGTVIVHDFNPVADPDEVEGDEAVEDDQTEE